MRILQVCQDSYGETGGISIHVRNISERLARRHNVTVYAANYGSRLPKLEWKNSVRVERFDCLAPSNAYFLSIEMLLRMRKTDFDVVHAHGYHAFPMHFASLAKCDKFVVTTHFHGVGHSPFRNCLIKLFKPVGKRTLAKAGTIIAVSEHEKRLLHSQFKLAGDKVVVISNGVDFSEFSGLEKEDRGFRSILYVGYLLGYKGAQYLVEVLPKLPDDVILEIVGVGPLKPHLVRRADELGVSERVWFYQDLPRRELLQRYFDSDVFILLSKHEAYSLVVAEALTAGKPCVVANASALSEWIDNKNCFGIDLPVNLIELARLINNLLERRTRSEAIKNPRNPKILDWNEVVERLEGIYNL